ncbi:chromosome condensation regulator [Acrasis kona]|uniref:Chromosome condensation regulator n=1 Tax=Acrasis kona TaxID=1008807 RepID=A0AAW2ZBJ8_9EUKA
MTIQFLFVAAQWPHGQLAQGHFEDVFGPTPLTEQFISSNKNFKVVSASCGRRHTLVVTKDHGVWVCGANLYGQLGLPDTSNNYPEFSCINECFRLDSCRKLVKSSHCGYNYSYFITTDDQVWACGSNSNNKLGFDAQVKKIVMPQRLILINSTNTGNTNQMQWNVACGHFHAVFYKTLSNVTKTM